MLGKTRKGLADSNYSFSQNYPRSKEEGIDIEGGRK
jgi:hypothetical protein